MLSLLVALVFSGSLHAAPVHPCDQVFTQAAMSPSVELALERLGGLPGRSGSAWRACPRCRGNGPVVAAKRRLRGCGPLSGYPRHDAGTRRAGRRLDTRGLNAPI